MNYHQIIFIFLTVAFAASINLRLLCISRGIALADCHDNSIYEITKKAKGQLRAYISKLAFYVQGMEFDYTQFDIDREALGRELGYLGHYLNKAIPYNEWIVENYNFAEHTFKVMSDSVRCLGLFSGNSADMSLVRDVTQLNVALLVAATAPLSSSADISEYTASVLQFSRALDWWQRTFYGLRHAHQYAQETFQQQSAAAEHTLRVLVDRIPSGRVG